MFAIIAYAQVDLHLLWFAFTLGAFHVCRLVCLYVTFPRAFPKHMHEHSVGAAASGIPTLGDLA